MTQNTAKSSDNTDLRAILAASSSTANTREKTITKPASKPADLSMRKETPSNCKTQNSKHGSQVLQSKPDAEKNKDKDDISNLPKNNNTSSPSPGVSSSAKKIISSGLSAANTATSAVSSTIKSIQSVQTEGDTKKSFAEATVAVLSQNDHINSAIGKSYRTVKKKFVHNSDIKVSKKRKEKRYHHGYSQDVTPINSISNGIIRDSSGHYIKIMEILPINFYDMSIAERDDIARTFGMIFHNGPVDMHLKAVVDNSNPTRIIEHIKRKCEEEKWQRGISDNVVNCAQDIIKKIYTMSDKNALSTRYFIIFKYEGSSSDINDIIDDLETTADSIANIFHSCGNIVVFAEQDKATLFTGEILYYCLNRTSCRKETLQDRINRIINDTNFFNSSAEKTFAPSDADFLACKGLYFTNSDYWYQDGYYKTSFTLKSSGHPDYSEPGWIDFFLSYGAGTEVDIYTHKMPHDLTVNALQQYNRWKRVDINNPKRSSEKRNLDFGKYKLNASVLDCLESDQDLFEVNIFITISALTIGDLRYKKALLLKNLTQKKYYVEEAYANCRQYYLATLPLMYKPLSISKRNMRNYTTRSLESFYMYTSYTLCDNNGCVLGENHKNHSIVAINNYNTDIFPNANISLFGMTGSGKTYTTEIFARAMRVIGVRVFFILPVKAHEYLRGCKAISGQYIQLYPGSKDCINVCEIRPAQSIDKRVLKESIRKEPCLLTSKITFLIAWLKLNMLSDPMTSDELDILEVTLTQLYNDYGFTMDNDSAWADKKNKVIRESPIISDMYDRFLEIPSLKRVAKCLKKYVVGSCSNLNGRTNVDYTNKYNCIDVDQTNIPPDLIPAFLLLATEWVYSLIKEDRLSLDMLILEEIWKMLVDPSSSEQIRDLFKLIRGYGGAAMALTQDINDCLNNEAGKAILSGTAIKFIMHLEKPEGRRVVNALELPASYVDTFFSYRRGNAMLITGSSNIEVDIHPSIKEDYDFTTDSNHLRELEEQIQSGQLIL